MRMQIPRRIMDCAACVGLMTAFLVGALAVCAAPVMIGAALLQ